MVGIYASTLIYSLFQLYFCIKEDFIPKIVIISNFLLNCQICNIGFLFVRAYNFQLKFSLQWGRIGILIYRFFVRFKLKTNFKLAHQEKQNKKEQKSLTFLVANKTFLSQYQTVSMALKRKLSSLATIQSSQYILHIANTKLKTQFNQTMLREVWRGVMEKCSQIKIVYRYQVDFWSTECLYPGSEVRCK